ncbi:MAG: ATP-binding protein [Candidatus Fermentibacteraceae bacterium]|nr:ATP-binding protein [Candidatus Fermentibacteraceae bacterium]
MYPFSGIVGQDDAKLALAIAAVDPGIGGVLLSGMKGTGKSTLVRSFVNILPDQTVVSDCVYGCVPDDDRFLCDSCRDAAEAGKSLGTITRRPSLVTVPLGVTEDRLLGTINVEKLLKEGFKEFLPGLLANANNQVLYVDEVNLLSDNITDDILDACAGGFNTVEREGVSVTHPARFVLVGTMNPEEGNLRPQILDRFAMSVDVRTEMNPLRRIDIIERNLAWETDSERFGNAFGKADARLRKTISAARRRLEGIRLPVSAIETVAGAMSSLKVDGQRPDLVTIRAARAWAALEDRGEVNIEALKSVAPLCVCHRTRSGGMNQPPEPDELMEVLEKNSSASKSAGQRYFDPEKVLTGEE